MAVFVVLLVAPNTKHFEQLRSYELQFPLVRKHVKKTLKMPLSRCAHYITMAMIMINCFIHFFASLFVRLFIKRKANCQKRRGLVEVGANTGGLSPFCPGITHACERTR